MKSLSDFSLQSASFYDIIFKKLLDKSGKIFSWIKIIRIALLHRSQRLYITNIRIDLINQQFIENILSKLWRFTVID